MNLLTSFMNCAFRKCIYVDIFKENPEIQNLAYFPDPEPAGLVEVGDWHHPHRLRHPRHLQQLHDICTVLYFCQTQTKEKKSEIFYSMVSVKTFISKERKYRTVSGETAAPPVITSYTDQMLFEC